MAFVLLLVVAGAVLLFHELTTPYSTVAASPPSDAALASGKQKLSAVSAATKQAQNSGKPVPVSVTLNDAEMTSLVADALQLAAQTNSLPPIEGVRIHAAGSGRLQVMANVHAPFMNLPLFLSARITTAGRESLDADVSELSVGRMPLHVGAVYGIVDQVRQQLASRINLPASGSSPSTTWW